MMTWGWVMLVVRWPGPWRMRDGRCEGGLENKNAGWRQRNAELHPKLIRNWRIIIGFRAMMALAPNAISRTQSKRRISTSLTDPTKTPYQASGHHNTRTYEFRAPFSTKTALPSTALSAPVSPCPRHYFLCPSLGGDGKFAPL